MTTQLRTAAKPRPVRANKNRARLARLNGEVARLQASGEYWSVSIVGPDSALRIRAIRRPESLVDMFTAARNQLASAGALVAGV